MRPSSLKSPNAASLHRAECGQREKDHGAVEVVAIDGKRSTADEEQIEITIVVEIDEQRPARLLHRVRRRFPDIVEPFAFAIVRQIASTVRPDREEVEPPVVVEVRECRSDGAGGQWQRPCPVVGDKAAVHRVDTHAGDRPPADVLAVPVWSQRQRRHERT
jgi:hypothetical protein